MIIMTMHENTRRKEEKLIGIGLGHQGAKLGHGLRLCRDRAQGTQSPLVICGSIDPTKRASMPRRLAMCVSVHTSPCVRVLEACQACSDVEKPVHMREITSMHSMLCCTTLPRHTMQAQARWPILRKPNCKGDSLPKAHHSHSMPRYEAAWHACVLGKPCGLPRPPPFGQRPRGLPQLGLSPKGKPVDPT